MRLYHFCPHASSFLSFSLLSIPFRFDLYMPNDSVLCVHMFVHVDMDHSAHKNRAPYICRALRRAVAIGLAWARLALCVCVHLDKATALQCIIIIFNVVTHGNQTNFQSVCIHFDRIICTVSERRREMWETHRESKRKIVATTKKIGRKYHWANCMPILMRESHFSIFFSLYFPRIYSHSSSKWHNRMLAHPIECVHKAYSANFPCEISTKQTPDDEQPRGERMNMRQQRHRPHEKELMNLIKYSTYT